MIEPVKIKNGSHNTRMNRKYSNEVFQLKSGNDAYTPKKFVV